MNRLKFISAFFATAVAAMAQTIKFRPAVVNGECPHCGLIKKPIPPYSTPFMDKAETVSYVVRCKRCSAAFFQDTEPALQQAGTTALNYPYLVREWRS